MQPGQDLCGGVGRRLIEMGEADSVPTLIADAEELCVNCGHCVAVCPSGALALRTMRPEDCPEIKKELLIDLEQAETVSSIKTLHSKLQGRPCLNVTS